MTFAMCRWSRKAALGQLLLGVDDGIAYNQHFAGDGTAIFQHACALGYEPVVSKWLGSYDRSGRVEHWLKTKILNAPAVRREAEEDGGERPWARGGRFSR